MPRETTSTVMIYNKTLIEESGVNLPTEFEWDITHMPHNADETRTTRVAWAGHSIYSGMQNVEAAWSWLKMVESQAAFEHLAATGLSVPAHRAVAESPAYLGEGTPPAAKHVFLEGLSSYYVYMGVPLHLLLALLAALAMNLNLRGIRFYRAVYFIPSITPVVASSLLWLWIFNPEFGLANSLLNSLGFSSLYWLQGGCQ